MKSLLVLGNGFDIYCGPNSKFDDFFKTKLGNARKAADTFNNTICTNF